MSAFCGWLDPESDDPSPQTTLKVMAGAFRGRRLRSGMAAVAARSTWVSDRNAPLSLYHGDDVWAVMVGTPSWRLPALQAVQQARGVAAALRFAYREHGQGLLDLLMGAFAFAVLDLANRQALLAIDRMGIHGLYYARDSRARLVFGTTADMVRAHPAVGASVPLQAVYGYLFAFVCRSPGTIYGEQCKLGPAQCLLWQNGEIELASYWRSSFEPDRQRRPEELGEELVAQVRRAVRASVPPGKAATTGAFLSGGLDSSTVAGMLGEVTPGPPDTFTIGFNENSYDEMRYAESAVQRFGARAHRFYLTAEDTAEAVPEVAAYCSEPFGNSSALPTYYCAAQATEAGMTRLLAGDGGDEIFAGNTRYLDQLKPTFYARLPASLRAALKLAAFQTPVLRQTPLWRHAQQYVVRGEAPLPDRLESYNFYQPERLAEVFDEDALRTLDIDAPWRDMREIYNGAASTDTLQRMMHLDLKQALADGDLRKVTGMCDLAGIDVAFPFLDDELVAFCATIPPELHLKNGRLRAFFKDAFRTFLPDEVIAKKKHGFGMPFYEWTRDHQRLRQLAYDSLATLRQRHLVRGDFLDTVMREHARPEPTPYDGLVWDLMMLELWFDSHGL